MLHNFVQPGKSPHCQPNFLSTQKKTHLHPNFPLAIHVLCKTPHMEWWLYSGSPIAHITCPLSQLKRLYAGVTATAPESAHVLPARSLWKFPIGWLTLSRCLGWHPSSIIHSGSLHSPWNNLSTSFWTTLVLESYPWLFSFSYTAYLVYQEIDFKAYPESNYFYILRHFCYPQSGF